MDSPHPLKHRGFVRCSPDDRRVVVLQFLPVRGTRHAHFEPLTG